MPHRNPCVTGCEGSPCTLIAAPIRIHGHQHGAAVRAVMRTHRMHYAKRGSLSSSRHSSNCRPTPAQSDELIIPLEAACSHVVIFPRTLRSPEASPMKRALPFLALLLIAIASASPAQAAHDAATLPPTKPRFAPPSKRRPMPGTMPTSPPSCRPTRIRPTPPSSG